MTEDKKKKIYYAISMPERFVRSTVSGLTSVTSLTTDLALPKALKESSTYRVTVGMLQQFLIEKVAEVEKTDSQVELVDKYVVRKTAGSIIEGIGLISVRFSPVWMLAILSDVTGGSKAYLERLTRDLKQQGLIDKETSYDSAYALLDSISSFSDKGVSAIDTPPISINELKNFKDEMTEEFTKNADATKMIYQDMEAVYKKMQKTSRDQKISMSKLNGTMTLDAMNKTGNKQLDLVKAGSMSSLNLLKELFVDSYMDSLDHLNHVGKRAYLIKHMTPFMKQVKGHYLKNNVTLTEKVLTRLFGEGKG